MTWWAAGAVVVGSLYSSNQAGKSAARDASRASAAEGVAITKERLNTTIRNSYATSAAQMQLAMRKRQLAQQGADISAATLAAKGDAKLATASTGSIGASTQAIVSDIEMKSGQALDMTTDAYENAVENYNSDLNMMVINVDQTAPSPTKYEYNGPSSGQMIGSALIAGAVSFAGSYASKKMSLGLGSAPVASSNVSTMNTVRMGYNPSAANSLGNTSSFFNTRF